MTPIDELCSLRWNAQRKVTEVIDQTLLPHRLAWLALETPNDFCVAISAMHVRGAPLIGITAAFGIACAAARDPDSAYLKRTAADLIATRPTAVNLRWAAEQMLQTLLAMPEHERANGALQKALALREEDIAVCERIGLHGLQQLTELAVADRPLNVLTHCNAGWLATVRWGTALAPIYKAHAAGVPVHVWVSETRPRNQGMLLTAWELQRAGVDCTVVTDNNCGQLMREGRVDTVIVGSDRTAANGDVCNKVGTYLKALAAGANNVPFYVALPVSTIDWDCASGDAIPIESRGEHEVLHATGALPCGTAETVAVGAGETKVLNQAFDVTPAEFVTGLITEYGLCCAETDALAKLHKSLS